jgi:hypothetical protein
MNRHVRHTILCVVTVAFLSPLASAEPKKQSLLRQAYTPGVYYLVTYTNTFQKAPADPKDKSDSRVSEINNQEIWVVKMVVGNPGPDGNKSLAITYERIQQTTNLNGKKVMDYDSKGSNPKTQRLQEYFSPLLNAKIVAVLDGENNVVSVRGLEGIWEPVRKKYPNAKHFLDMLKLSFNNEAQKEMIQSVRNLLSPNPVSIGESWTNKQTIPTLMGNRILTMNMTFASIEKEQGRRLALISFSGNTIPSPKSETPATTKSAEPKGSLDIQQKGLMRFDISAGRMSELMLQQTMIFTAAKNTEKENGRGPAKTTIHSAISVKQYFNEVPPELTAPPSTSPATKP